MEFLLEIMTEEMPSSHVRLAWDQLQALFNQELSEARIGLKDFRLLGTGRRLVVLADIEEKQAAREEIGDRKSGV